ncbi:MAG: cobalamin-binding protein [Chloroflexi bacterium]|nr:cobalamin-binding protein [Chloroflexota bacterium]
MELLEKLGQAIYDGDAEAAAALTREALDGGRDPQQILDGGLIHGMDAVGKDFREGILFVPEVLIAARAMHAAMALLRPLLAEGASHSRGLMVLGTVKGDLHDIGKNLVGMMMEGAGFQVVDLGADVGPAAFVEAVKTHKPQLLGMSALLTTTMMEMKGTIAALEEAGVRQGLKVLVGGAPVTQRFAEEIGADGYASNASAAVERSRELLGA